MNHALTKKKMDNDTKSALLILQGEIEAAINDGDCFESSLRIAEAHGAVPTSIYQTGINACSDFGKPLKAFRDQLGCYRTALLKARDSLSE